MPEFELDLTNVESEVVDGVTVVKSAEVTAVSAVGLSAEELGRASRETDRVFCCPVCGWFLTRADAVRLPLPVADAVRQHADSHESWPRPDPAASAPPLDIAAFLRARLDEREAKADGALSGPWTVEEHTYETVVTVDGGQVVASVDGLRDGWHIADNDPAFVLADVAAKRMILDQCTDAEEDCNAAPGTLQLADAVRAALALPYATHPDYDESWKP